MAANFGFIACAYSWIGLCTIAIDCSVNSFVFRFFVSFVFPFSLKYPFYMSPRNARSHDAHIQSELCGQWNRLISLHEIISGIVHMAHKLQCGWYYRAHWSIDNYLRIHLFNIILMINAMLRAARNSTSTLICFFICFVYLLQRWSHSVESSSRRKCSARVEHHSFGYDRAE